MSALRREPLRVTRQAVCAGERLLECVQRAGADVAVYHAQRCEYEHAEAAVPLIRFRVHGVFLSLDQVTKR